MKKRLSPDFMGAIAFSNPTISKNIIRFTASNSMGQCPEVSELTG